MSNNQDINRPSQVNLTNNQDITSTLSSNLTDTSTQNNTVNIAEDIDPFINYIKPYKNETIRKQSRFNGRCKACGWEGHHWKDCYFLRKLQKCLSFLQIRPNLAKENKIKYKDTYNQRRNIVRSLQQDHFIPYDDVDPDVFIDDIDNFADFEQYEWDVISVCTVLSEESYSSDYESNYNDVEINVINDNYNKSHFFQPTQLDDPVIDISMHEPIPSIYNSKPKPPPEPPPNINPIQYNNDSYTTIDNTETTKEI